MTGLPTDLVSLDEYMGVWFRCEVSEAVKVHSMGISFRTELQEKIASRRLVIEHLENVGATSGWVVRLKRDQEEDVSLLGLLDTFVHMMYEIVRKREKDISVGLKCLQMQACKCKLQMLACKCLLQMQAAYAGCKCLLVNACLQMLTANASGICRLQMLACKCKSKLQIQGANFR
ncbi:hypothetical protein Tco_0103192 [Tanacetum coccineum]